jgi:type IV pilus assembly protein PilF
MKTHVRLAALLFLALAAAAGAQQRVPNENPKITAARLNAQLAVAYLKQNDVAAAREKIDKALQQNPRDADVQTAAGLVFERVNEVDKADRAYADAMHLEPHNPDRVNNYAVFLCRRGHAAQGQKLFEQAAHNSAYATPEVAYTNAGVCARGAGNLAVAEEHFRKALAVRPNYPDALLQMADLSFARGEGLKARAFLQRQFNVAPETPDALLLAVKVERSLGDARAADEFAARLQAAFPESDQARQLRRRVGDE